MKMSLEVFEVIRTAAKSDSGTALLMPFDGSLFMDYSPEKIKLFGLIDGAGILLYECDLSAYDAATIACIERAWLSRDHADGLVFATMLDTMMGMPFDALEQRSMMRLIIKNWSCLQHMKEFTNG
jgi:hypothetical protein